MFTQFAAPGQLVVVQHLAEVMLNHPAKLTPQRFQAGLSDVRRAAAEGDDGFIIARVEHGQHLIPLGDLHRALNRARHRRYRRLGFTRGDKIAGTRLRGDQPLLFQRLVGLLHGADAHPVLLTQAAYRRQFFAVAIQPLLNTFCQQTGQMLVTRHAVSLIAAIQIDKPVQMDEKKATQIPF